MSRAEGIQNCHRMKTSMMGLWRGWSRADPGVMGRIYIKLSRGERFVPEGSADKPVEKQQRAVMLERGRGQTAGGPQISR